VYGADSFTEDLKLWVVVLVVVVFFNASLLFDVRSLYYVPEVKSVVRPRRKHFPSIVLINFQKTAIYGVGRGDTQQLVSSDAVVSFFDSQSFGSLRIVFGLHHQT
jgi:hypothetical protein